MEYMIPFSYSTTPEYAPEYVPEYVPEYAYTYAPTNYNDTYENNTAIQIINTCPCPCPLVSEISTGYIYDYSSIIAGATAVAAYTITDTIGICLSKSSLRENKINEICNLNCESFENYMWKYGGKKGTGYRTDRKGKTPVTYVKTICKAITENGESWFRYLCQKSSRELKAYIKAYKKREESPKQPCTDRDPSGGRVSGAFGQVFKYINAE